MSKIHLEPVTLNNYQEAIKLQKAIFPHEDGSTNIRASVFPEVFEQHSAKYLAEMKYFICKDDQGQSIGMTGCYVQKGMPEDGWVGWYGVAESARGKGYGREILQETMNYMRKKGFENVRLYTDPYDNAAACQLYRKFGMLEESYQGENLNEEVTIFSKNLHGKEVTPIGKTNLNLKPRLESQRIDEPQTKSLSPMLLANKRGGFSK